MMNCPQRVQILSEGPCGDGQRRGSRHGAARCMTSPPVRSIAFHTAFNSELDFAEGIIDLAGRGRRRDRR